jgi:hypothetical protein
MTQYIGQITVILESDTPVKASETLCSLAIQLDDSCPEIIFADHNGDVEDYDKIEQECEEGPSQANRPLLPVLLASLETCATLLADYDEHPGEEGIAYREVIAAIALASGNASPAIEAATSTPVLTDNDFHALLAERREIAVIWCTEDVQEVRPDLTEGQSWEVLEATKRYHDATIGINWDVLSCHAHMLFGSAPAKAGEE